MLVEHSSINPNKAAHIGHLRNAILGDTFVRLLRFAGREVDVQNYIDNTGVQVADVVVGFLHIEKKSRAEIEALAAAPRFDYLCWDLYARVSQWYEEDKSNLQARAATLRSIEEGNNETAAVADLISIAVLKRHLETMERLDIEYDFLPRESEILHLHFWDAAFTKLKEAGVLTYEAEGKNKGCWVMRRAGTASQPLTTEDTENTEDKITEEDQKVIVRSNGTVGYVGKDIAYHMWKFGLLGRDFGYRKFFRYPNTHDCWISTTDGETRSSTLWRCGRNLQRDRCAPVRGAEHGDRSFARTGPRRGRRSLHPFFLRDGRAHSALRRRTRLPTQRRRQGEIVDRGFGPQGFRREGRRSSRCAHHLGAQRSRCAPSRVERI